LSEARRASTLNSENIAAVYDVLQRGCEVFLVLEFVEGVTLRHRLQEQVRISIDSTLHIAMQCAKALTEAEKWNVVHRDLKPENIMLADHDHVKLLDFGLACHGACSDLSALNTTQTLTGTLAGTPGYIAPEVLLQEQVDTRADIFSLGVVMYEMLTGRNPFAASQFVVTTERTLHSQPAAMSAARPDVPEELERIVFKMLAKIRSDRYATASELLADLVALQNSRALAPGPLAMFSIRNFARARTSVAVAAIAMFITMLILYRWGRHLVQAQLPAKKHLAVLPFRVESDNPEDKAFSRGLTETLTARLAQLKDRYGLQVVLPGEQRGLTIASATQARIEFGANLALEGSLHRAGNRVRVIHRLVDTTSEKVLRAETLTADLSDPFALEDHVVDSALRSLELELDGDQTGSTINRN